MKKKIVLTCLIVFLSGTLFAFPRQGFNRDVWEVTDFVWDCGIVALCDKGPDPHPPTFFINEYSSQFNRERYRNIRAGDIVWIQCRFIAQFYEEILPEVEGPIVLVVSVGDESFPSETGLAPEKIEEFLNSEKIVRIFAQNCDLLAPHPKVTLLPIGLDYHTISYKSLEGGWGEFGSPLMQEAQLKQILLQLPPTYLRKKRAFVDFQMSDTSGGGEKKRYLQLGENRTMIFNRLLRSGLIDHASWMKRSALWRTKGQYAFSISPHGNGLDCHRTWEDLILGCIVIVKTSPLDSMYEGLPVVVVKDWDEITDANLDRWLEQYKDAFTNPDYRHKLTHRYWMDQIKAVAQSYKKVMPE